MRDQTSLKRPRLLFVVESGTDVRMVNGLAQHFNLSVFARTISGGREINHEPSVPIKVERGPQSRVGFALSAARRAFSRTGHDVLLVQGYSLAAFGCNVATRLRGRTPPMMLVCSPIESYYRCRRLTQSGAPYRGLQLVCLQFIARLNAAIGGSYIVLSQYLESVIRAHGRTENIHRIPVYGVDTNLFRPLSGIDKTHLRKSRDIPEAGSVVFFSSRTAPEKDVPTLLEAFRRLLHEGEDLWLLHRSGGYEQFKAAAQSFGVAERVIASEAIYPGPELVADYQASDLCIQASREEGLGFSVLEALACEIPVIAASVGGLKETVIPGETGWTYAPGDASALQACIRAALDDPREAARRAKAGRALVREKYESSHSFEEFVDLVNRQIGPRLAGRKD
jgi:glycosyltransferase involved in cell wall biosynthesis